MFRLPQTVGGATRLLVLEGHASISSRARWARSTTDLGKGLVEHLQAAATRAVSRTMRGIHAAGRHHRVSGCSYDQRSRNAQLYFGCWGIAVRSRKFAAFWKNRLALNEVPHCAGPESLDQFHSFFLALASAFWNPCTQSTSVHPRATEPMMTNTYDNMIS